MYQRLWLVVAHRVMVKLAKIATLAVATGQLLSAAEQSIDWVA
jgi:hypothetical protein